MDNKLSNIKERILYVAKNQGYKYEDFFEKIGMSYGNFKGNNKNRPINSDAIADILTIIPKLNVEWLITGEGTPLKTEFQKEIKQNILGHNNTMVGNDLITDNSLTIKVLMNQLDNCKKIIEEKDSQINKLLNIMSYEKK